MPGLSGSYEVDDVNPWQTALLYAVESRQANGVRRITILSVKIESPWVYGIELVIQADGSGEGSMGLYRQVGLNKEGNDIELKAGSERLPLIRVRKE
jgi:hypothetical protein